MAEKGTKKGADGWVQGKSLLVTVVAVVVSLVAGFLGCRLVPLYYYYFDLQNHMRRAIASAAIETDEEIRRSLMSVIRRHGISCGERDLQVARDGDTIMVSLHYTEGLRVSLFGKEITLRSLDFDASAKGKIR